MGEIDDEYDDKEADIVQLFAAPLINKYSIKQQAAQKESFVCVYKYIPVIKK